MKTRRNARLGDWRLISLPGLFAGFGLFVVAAPALAIPGPGDVDVKAAPSFTADQAKVGSNVYQQHCATCHGDKLQGSAGPGLVGPGFAQRWESGNRSVGDLHGIIKSMMPMQAPGSLSNTQYIDVVAFLLAENGYRAGSTALASTTMDTKLVASAASGSPGASISSEPKPASFPAPAKSYGMASTNRPTDAELLENSDANWLMYNKDYSGQRYSGLRQINIANARKMNAVCVFQAGEVGSFQAAPVVYDGIMYITTAWNTFALNPSTCQKIWETDYSGTTPSPVSLTRGVAIYKGKVFRSTPNCHLIALDSKTGKILWDVLMSDVDKGYWLSGAPIAFDGKVFMGEAGADWGANSHLFAFDADTGKHIWTFDAIPTGKQPGAETWEKGAEHGGGSMWSTFALNPKSGLIFASIGNPSPDYNGALRPGDNLYTDSVVALDQKTGKLAWHVQQVPHDTHDWDTAASPALYDQGKNQYMAVMNKGGWLYIYDRISHKLIANPEISSHLNIDKALSPEPTRVCPGIIGGAEWNGPAYSPKDNLLFTNSVEWCGSFKLTETRFLEGSSYFGGSYIWDEPEKGKGWIRAFNATTGKEVWKQKINTPMVAGLTATAGGVIFTGNLDGEFLVLDAKTGNAIYRFNTGGAVAGAASTYLVDGKQYVAETSGNASRTVWHTSGAATVFVFALPKE